MSHSCINSALQFIASVWCSPHIKDTTRIRIERFKQAGVFIMDKKLEHNSINFTTIRHGMYPFSLRINKLLSTTYYIQIYITVPDITVGPDYFGLGSVVLDISTGKSFTQISFTVEFPASITLKILAYVAKYFDIFQLYDILVLPILSRQAILLALSVVQIWLHFAQQIQNSLEQKVLTVFVEIGKPVIYTFLYRA